MAPTRRYLVLAIFIAACFAHANCKAEPSESKDDTLYFRGNQNTNVASETNINANLEEADVKKNVFKNTEADDLERVEDPPKPYGGANRILQVPWWATFLVSLINNFYRQRPTGRSQFGVLYMGNTHIPNQNQFPLNFQPSNQDGTPVINNQNPLSPPTRGDYVNYVAARPQNVQHTMIHAERAILDEMNSLYNSYLNHYGHPPNMMVLYSWIMPCPDCTDRIINHFSQAPFSTVPYRVVAFTTEGTNSGLPYMTQEGNRNSRELLNANNITYWKQQCPRPPDLEEPDVDKALSRSTDYPVCKLSDTFQGCFVECLGHDFCCSCKESRKMSMNAAMVNDLAKDCATTDIKNCAKSWVQQAFSEHHGGASYCTDLESARAKLLSCVDTCVGRPLSKPLNPLKPSSYPGYLSTFSDISNYAPVTFADFCSDMRTEGYLCYNYGANSFTAGNSLCRSGSVCDLNGKSYKWCFTDFSGNWDYCCTGACSRGRSGYLSCPSGNQWQYCGDAGDITVKGRHCLAEFPCGMHQEKGKEGYYWCYTDTNMNRGYCCQPGDTCSKKKKTYDWCWTGYKKDTKPWEYCDT